MAIFRTSTSNGALVTLLTFALVASFVVAETDEDVCASLRVYIKNREQEFDYKPQRNALPDVEARLTALKFSKPASNMIKLNVILMDLNDELSKKEQSSCLGRLCGNFGTSSKKIEATLTHAHFHKAYEMLRANQLVPALVELERVKLRRRKYEGIAMSKVLDLEKNILDNLLDACENNPRRVLGVDEHNDDNWLKHAYARLRVLTETTTENDWQTEELLMATVHRMLVDAYNKLHQ